MPRVVIFDETGPPEVLHLVDEPPEAPAAGEVRIKMEAVGVNPLDQLMRSGNYPGTFRLPHARLGCEGTGTIDALGTGVDDLGVGEPVIITAVPAMDVNGTYADYAVVPATAVIARPAGLDAAGAAALWVAHSTAYGALVEKARMQPGDHVLITGASGAVGLAALQIANQIGAIPIAVTRRSAKKDGLLAAGATAVIATDRDDIVESAHQLTGGVGVDVIMDAVMGPGLAELARAAKFGGTLVAVGWLDSRPAPFPMNWPLNIFGHMSFQHTLDAAMVHRIAAFLAAGLRSGVLHPTIDKVFELDDIADAHRYLERGQQFGKVVVTV